MIAGFGFVESKNLVKKVFYFTHWAEISMKVWGQMTTADFNLVVL